MLNQTATIPESVKKAGKERQANSTVVLANCGQEWYGAQNRLRDHTGKENAFANLLKVGGGVCEAARSSSRTRKSRD